MTKMKTFLPHAALATAFCTVAVLGATPASFAAKGGIDFLPESKIWLEGDSTLHRYEATAKKFQASADWDGKGALSGLEVVIPVKDLKSNNGDLDKNMHNALKAAQHGTIRFSVGTGTLTIAPSGAATARADGQLTIAGTKKPVTVTAEGKRTGDTLRLKGSRSLMMSEFGVQPPVLMMGAIKVADKVTVHFDLVAKVSD